MNRLINKSRFVWVLSGTNTPTLFLKKYYFVIVFFLRRPLFTTLSVNFLLHFFLPITLPYKTFRNNLWMTSHSFVSNKYVSEAHTTSPKHIYQTLQTTKKRTLKNRQVNKFSKTTIALNPVQSPSSLSTRSCYLYPTFMFWSVIFMVHSDWWRLLLLEFW